jgi:hypothetical protein
LSGEVDWKSLTVVVYQVLVNGKKPTGLIGSDDAKFKSFVYDNGA